jgi:hypothetical protein
VTHKNAEKLCCFHSGFFIKQDAAYNDRMTSELREKTMIADGQPSEAIIQKLRDIRVALLRLHKTLLEHEREIYERAHGKIGSSYEYLNLVMENPFFSWLRHLSELIVQIDELLDARDSATESTAAALIQQSRMLLTPNEGGPEFQRKYFASVQGSPEVVLAHAEFAKLFGPGRLSKEVH